MRSIPVYIAAFCPYDGSSCLLSCLLFRGHSFGNADWSPLVRSDQISVNDINERGMNPSKAALTCSNLVLETVSGRKDNKL